MRSVLPVIIGIATAISYGQRPAKDSASVQGRVLSQSTEVPLRGVELYLVSKTDSASNDGEV